MLCMCKYLAVECTDVDSSSEIHLKGWADGWGRERGQVERCDKITKVLDERTV